MNNIYLNDSINWDDLNAIGITREQLQENDDYDLLLNGDKTGIQTLKINVLGVDIILDAQLQLVDSGNGRINLEAIGITPDYSIEVS